MKYSGWLYNFYHKYIMPIPPKIWWIRKRRLTEEDKEKLASYFAKGYYIILVGDRGHLSSTFFRCVQFFLTGKWQKYTHALINCDMMDSISDRDKFKFMEATAVGVHWSSFDEVFNECDYVCLLSPTNIENSHWTEIIDKVILQKGKEYDDLFDFADDTQISCVELVLDGLKSLPDFHKHFGRFDELIREEKHLIPMHFKECWDFKTVCEI